MYSRNFLYKTIVDYFTLQKVQNDSITLYPIILYYKNSLFNKAYVITCILSVYNNKSNKIDVILNTLKINVDKKFIRKIILVGMLL